MNSPAPAGPFDSDSRDGWPVRHSRIGAILAVALVLMCSVPMFIGLDRQDIRNDEAIYTYAAQRMVETGDWLTPRYVDTDGLFLEKPPLKFWLVAGPVQLGLIPNTEAGIRLVDATLGTVAFAFVMALGWHIGGVVCGAVALVWLLAFHPLLFDHGLRENNMESALFLSYAAALFHFVRWASAGSEGERRRQALACGLWFVLGFMTKFVAAVFLPAVALAALLVAPGGWRYLKTYWKDWILPAIVAAALIAPWFIYQMIVHPDDFWATIFDAHVVLRFTEFVDPAHVQPWHFYISDLWARLQSEAASHRRISVANMDRGAVVAGLGFLLWRLRGSARGMAALLLIWWVVPVGLISLGTSKVLHYTYPFLPPLALSVGWVCSHALLRLDRHLTPRVEGWAGRLRRHLHPPGPRYRWLIGTVAVSTIGLTFATYVAGPVEVAPADGPRLFRNSSTFRPLLLAALLLIWLGYTRSAVRTIAVVTLLFLLPIETASQTVERATRVDHPLRSARECIDSLTHANTSLRRGIYRSDPFYPELAVHQLYYTFRGLGPWVEGMEGFDAEVSARLGDPARQSPMLLTPAQWRAIRATRVATNAEAIRVAPDVVLALPGPYRPCATDIISGGGRAFERESGE